MTSRIKALCIACLTIAVLAACGGGNNAGEPVASDAPPVVSEQPMVPQQPQDPQDDQVPQEPVQPQEPEVPEVPQLPLANQTGWTIQGIFETRKPLEFVKEIVCAERAILADMETMPASSSECSTTFPELTSGEETGHPYFQEMVPPGSATEKREGCTYVPDTQTLICGWAFIMPDTHSGTGYSKFYLAIPFAPSFSLALQACEAGKDHMIPDMFSRATAQGPSVKDAELSSICADWQAAMPLAMGTESGMIREDIDASK